MMKGEMTEGGLDLAELEGALLRLRQAMTLTQRFRQLALLVVTRQLDAGEVSGLRPLFDSFDTDHNGTISLCELYHGLKVVDEGVTPV
jgi:Ca2+-binding EF-hand superfamily protein